MKHGRIQHLYRTGWLNPHCGVGNMLYRHGYQEATSTKYPRLLSVSYLRHTLELYKLVLVDIYFSCGPWLRVSWEFYILPLFDRGPLISLLQSLYCHSPFTVHLLCLFNSIISGQLFYFGNCFSHCFFIHKWIVPACYWGKWIFD